MTVGRNSLTLLQKSIMALRLKQRHKTIGKLRGIAYWKRHELMMWKEFLCYLQSWQVQ
jgi:hypothetical protein